jgi:ankyrin repeat protein
MRLGKLSAFVSTFALSLLLLAYYPSVRDEVNWYAQRELCRAAAKGETTKMRALIFLGASPHGWNTTYDTLLFAARNGQTEAVRMLLDMGGEVDSRGLWLQTPLMEAGRNGHVETTELLLSRGAELCATDKHGGTTLFQAASVDQVHMVELLLSHGAGACKDAESALSSAVERGGRVELVKSLLSGGVDPRDVTATHLLLPLHEFAERNGDDEIAALLIRFGSR